MLLVIWELIGKRDGFSSGLGFIGMVFGWRPQGERGPGSGWGFCKTKASSHSWPTKWSERGRAWESFHSSVLVKIYDGSSFPFIRSHLPPHQPIPPSSPPPNISSTCESEGFIAAQVQNTPSVIPHYLLAFFFCFCTVFVHLSFFYHFLSCDFFLSCWTLLLFFSHVLCSSLALSSPQARH